MRVHVDEQTLRQTFAGVRDDPVFAESAAAVEAGRLPVQMFQALSLAPKLLEGFTGISRGVYPGGKVEREVKEVIILEASRLNRCQFCTQSHIEMCRSIGLSDDPLTMLDEPAALSDRQRLAQELTRAMMADSNNVPDALFAQLQRVFSDAEIVEVVFMIGFINCLNLFNNTLGIRYNGEYSAT